jgi:hypothetical protein
MNERAKRLSRRHFLLAAGTGGAATAAAIVARNAAPPLPPATRFGKRATRGYQASEHVNNYYRTTKV